MCLSFPALVVAVDDQLAVVETAGRRRRASTLLFPDVVVGEWVAVAAGSIIDRLTAAEAAELQAILDTGAVPGSTTAG